MGKLSVFFSKQKNNIKEIYLTYSVTIIAAILLSVFLVVYNHNTTSEILNHINVVLVLLLCWSFFFESFYYLKENNKLKRIITSGIGLAVSIVFDIIMDKCSDINDIVDMYITNISIFYIVFFVGAGLFIIIRKQKIEFSEYAARVVFGLLRAAGLFLSLFIATILILELFDNLIVDIDYWRYLYDVELLLCGIIYLPACLTTLLKADEENSKFTKAFVKYALMPCVLVAMLIIYIYIFKIFFTWQIPSNEIFNICTLLFAICMPIWTMAYAFTKDSNNIYSKLIKYIKYIYSPFIILEIYSIGVRISDYGMTEPRYAAVVFIILQIIYILWEVILKVVDILRKREKRTLFAKNYEYMILVIIVFIFIYLLVPGINATYASFLSQKNRFEGNVEGNIVEASESMEYLLYNNIYGRRYFDENYTQDYIDKFIKANNEVVREHWRYIHFYDSLLERGLDISSYDRIYEVWCNQNEEEYYEDDNIEAEVQFRSDTDLANKELSINIANNLSYFVDLYDSNKMEFDEPYIIKVNSEHITDKEYYLCVYGISFAYSEETNKYKELSINGYLLEKDIGGTENE